VPPATAAPPAVGTWTPAAPPGASPAAPVYFPASPPAASYRQRHLHGIRAVSMNADRISEPRVYPRGLERRVTHHRRDKPGGSLLNPPPDRRRRGAFFDAHGKASGRCCFQRCPTASLFPDSFFLRDDTSGRSAPRGRSTPPAAARLLRGFPAARWARLAAVGMRIGMRLGFGIAQPAAVLCSAIGRPRRGGSPRSDKSPGCSRPKMAEHGEIVLDHREKHFAGQVSRSSALRRIDRDWAE